MCGTRCSSARRDRDGRQRRRRHRVPLARSRTSPTHLETGSLRGTSTSRTGPHPRDIWPRSDTFGFRASASSVLARESPNIKARRCRGMPNVAIEDRNTGDAALCVLKVVHVVEALRGASGGLRVAQLLSITGYSRSTLYRILKTLARCGYILCDGEGTYRLNQMVIRIAESRHKEFERWGIRFRADGKRAAALPSSGSG